MKLKELANIEKSRTYTWNEDLAVHLKGITHFKEVKETHRLRTMDEKLHVIPEGWIHLEIDATEFNF